MAAVALHPTFNQDAVEGIIVRWSLAQEYVTDLDMDSLPAERALLVLIRQDVPNVMKEIIRLRPELR